MPVKVESAALCGHFLRVVVLTLLVVSGCASRPTGYIDAAGNFNAPYGYTVTRMGDEDYSILVRANEATPSQRVAQIALLRAANLTLEKGGTQFAIIHSEGLVFPYQNLVSVAAGGAFIPVGSVGRHDKLAVLIIHVYREDGAAQDAHVIGAPQVVTDLTAAMKQ
jgi:hypothetical protein